MHMRRLSILAAATCAVSPLAGAVANAGAVADLYRGGAFGLPWNAGKGAIEAKYPGGKWDEDGKGHPRYCVASKQTLLKLPPPHQTQELCMVIGTDNTLASVTAVMEPSLQSLLAVVNRCRTTFGDFDSVVRDETAIQSRSNGMLWTGDAPYVVRIDSQNNEVGSPTRVAFIVADEANLYTEGSKKVSSRPGS
jgi:hypothetical protein